MKIHFSLLIVVQLSNSYASFGQKNYFITDSSSTFEININSVVPKERKDSNFSIVKNTKTAYYLSANNYEIETDWGDFLPEKKTKKAYYESSVYDGTTDSVHYLVLNPGVGNVGFQNMNAKYIQFLSVNPAMIHSDRINCDLFQINARSNPVFFSHRDTIKRVYIQADSLLLALDSSRLQALIFERTGHLKLDLINSLLPDTLSFTFCGGFPSLDLRTFRAKSKPCEIFFYETDISNFNLDYRNFHLLDTCYGFKIPVSEMLELYTELLEMQKRKGYTEGYVKLDQEIREFKYLHTHEFLGTVRNWIDKNWWGYGYAKYLIFKNSIFLLFIFSFLNFFVFRKLSRETYIIEEVVLAYDKISRKYINKPITRILRHLVYCFIYTSYIFWGWKLDLSKLKLANLWLACWIILQYLIGIICLAYLANYVITR